MIQQDKEITGWQFWLLNLLAGISLVLFFVNIILSFNNKEVQNKITKRQQYINQSIKISQLNSQLIQSLANLSAKTGDMALRDILLRQGIRFSVNKVAEPDSKPKKQPVTKKKQKK